MIAAPTGGDLHDDIALIEARIEELGGQIERCRKISLAAKLTVGAGAIWIVLTFFGAVQFAAAPLVAALAAVIGGTVLLGSNATTWAQTQDALRASEGLRAGMIGRMELKVVGEESRTIH